MAYCEKKESITTRMKNKIKYFFTCLLVTISFFDSRAQLTEREIIETRIDSLLQELKKNSETQESRINDSIKIDILNSLFEAYNYGLNDRQEALKCVNEMEAIARKTGNKAILTTALRKKGNVYLYQFVYEKAVELYLAAFKVAEEANDKRNMANSLNNLGNVYVRMGELSNSRANYEKGLDCLLQALAIFKAIGGNMGSIANSHLNISNVYVGLGQHQKAIDNLLEARRIYRQLNGQNGIVMAETNLGNTYIDWAKKTNKKEYAKKAEAYFVSGIKSPFEDSQAALSFIKFGEIRLFQNNIDESIYYLTKGYLIAVNLKSDDNIKDAAELLAQAFQIKGDNKQALAYHKIWRALKDTLLSEKSNKHITELNTKFEVEKKEKDIELLKKDAALQESEIDRLSLILYVFIVGLILMVLLMFVLYNRFSIKRKLNIRLDNTNKSLLQKNELVEKQKEKILSSIAFARLMQQSIVLDEQDIPGLLPNSFIYYQPKDIVSGDFYWCSKINGKIVLAIVDCTGHGVPGAFMSIIGNTLLNQIIKQKQNTVPSEILSHLSKGVYEVLQQNKENPLSEDGMDIAVCCIDYENSSLQFAGAGHSLYIMESNELKIIKGDIHSIGGMKFLSKRMGVDRMNYCNHTIAIKKNMSIYLSTDGYTDQFGGSERKKFGMHRFQEMLFNCQQKDMEEQKEIVTSALESWKGNVSQIDDILVVGIKL
jgi:serine phosphatase RsbU (regulator of sigma subunit)